MRFRESLLLNLAISGLFVLAGYLTGRMAKRLFIAIVLLVLLCSVPIFVASYIALSVPRMPIVEWLVIWGVSTTLLAPAGYAISRKKSLGWAAVCLLCLIQVTYVSTRWIGQTHWIDSMRWHQINGNRMRVGSWEFVVPDAWLPAFMSQNIAVYWRDLGVSEMLYLQRVSLFTTRNQATIEILTPLSSVAGVVKRVDGMGQDRRFQIQGEYGKCLLKTHENQELRFSESCEFPNADLYVSIEGRTEDELNEAAHILSGAQFIKTSDPYTIRQSS